MLNTDPKDKAKDLLKKFKDVESSLTHVVQVLKTLENIPGKESIRFYNFYIDVKIELKKMKN